MQHLVVQQSSFLGLQHDAISCRIKVIQHIARHVRRRYCCSLLLTMHIMMPTPTEELQGNTLPHCKLWLGDGNLMAGRRKTKAKVLIRHLLMRSINTYNCNGIIYRRQCVSNPYTGGTLACFHLYSNQESFDHRLRSNDKHDYKYN